MQLLNQKLQELDSWLQKLLLQKRHINGPVEMEMEHFAQEHESLAKAVWGFDWTQTS